MKKKVLITGARGLLGSACVRALLLDYEVFTSDGVDLREKDKTRMLFVRTTPDYVIHCAAKVGGVKANRDNPVEFIEQNTAINGNVISACYDFNVERLVNVGTSCMFPRDATLPVKESSFQTGPLEPDVEAYASAKILAYMTCKAYYHQFKKRFVTVAPSNLYGPWDSYGEEAHVIPALIRKAYEAKRNGGFMSVWGDGSAVRDFLHSDDAANAIRIVLERWDSPELVSIGSGQSVTIKELADTIAAMFGVKGILWETAEPTGVPAKTYDVSRLQSLGWSQKVDLASGLSQVCYDYEHNINIRKK